MPKRLREGTERIFDHLERRWQLLKTQRRVASALVVVFVVGLALVEARRIPWLSQEVIERLPSNHFEAILLPFTLLLLAEVISLVFALAQSVAMAVGKQLEIMSLILIRQSFKELTYLDEPIFWPAMSSEVSQRVLFILSDAIGALVIFALLALYYKLQPHRPITRDADEQSNFIASKKLIALVLLLSLALLSADYIAAVITGSVAHGFFEVFYTLLIFADVLIVLISLRYNISYPVVFRYFGFAVATVMIRLALTAPRVADAALGVGATLFSIALTWAYNRSAPILETDPVVDPPEHA
jgi:hypothetical protein